MRIAFDYQAFSRQSAGGISRYFCRLVDELHGFEETVGVFAPLYRNQYLAQVSGALVHGTYLKSYPPRTAEAIVAINRWLSRRQVRNWHPDLVHETYFSPKSVVPPGCPVVLTVFDMIPELESQARGVAPGALRLTAKYSAVTRADRIICISECTRQDLIGIFGIQPDKVSVVHLGCDSLPQASDETEANDGTEAIDGTEASDATGARPRAKRPFLLYVGLREGYKNFDSMLRAIALSSRLSGDFDVVAFGGGAFSAHEQAQIRELGFREGQVRQQAGDDQALARLYRAAAAFIYPSTYEGFGLPPLEAMTLGCPVICSDRSSIPEVVGDAGEYFNPDHPESIARAIEAVVYSCARTTTLMAAGRQRAALFTWRRCAQGHLDVYRSLVNA